MSNANIHPMAIVEPGAHIGEGVTVEAFAVVKATVTLGDHVVIKSHAYVDGNTTIGEGTVVWPFASIGTKAQDLKYRGEKTFVNIGKYCEIREYATINSSCQEGSVVRVGDHCLIMAYCHVAHNCEIGSHVVMANGAMLAGHVIVEDHAIIAGMTPVHQFSRIGAYAMVGGLSRVTHDVPPFTLGAGSPYKVGGLNMVGLKRHNFSPEVRRALTRAFRITYRSGLRLSDALQQIQSEFASHSHVQPYIQHWLDFCASSKRGLIGLHLESKEEPEDLQDQLLTT